VFKLPTETNALSGAKKAHPDMFIHGRPLKRIINKRKWFATLLSFPNEKSLKRNEAAISRPEAFLSHLTVGLAFIKRLI
jgi:hypothetical protein